MEIQQAAAAAGMGVLVFALLISGALIAVVVVYGKRHGEELRSKGLITAREYGFHEREYIYSSPVFDFDTLLDAIKQVDLDEAGAHASWSASRASKAMEFSSPAYDYVAQLHSLKDMNGEHRYQFKFTHWTARNGTANHTDRMNRLMTALEKAMLGLDPYVTVRSQYMEDLKSKAKFL